MRTIESAFGVCLLLLLSTTNYAQIKIDSGAATNRTCLPTGACLDPAGRSFAVGNMPLAMALSPEGDRIVISLSGWRQQGLQVVERRSEEHTSELQSLRHIVCRLLLEK